MRRGSRSSLKARRSTLLAVMMVSAIGVAGCGGSGSSNSTNATSSNNSSGSGSSSSSGGASSNATENVTSTGLANGKPGGTVTIADASFQLTCSFDPTCEYAYQPWTLYSIMMRTLVSYKHVPGVAGTQIVPDLATAMPAVSGHGLTYTFHIKSGVRFGPPMNRDVTSHDIAYAFERMASANQAAQYGFYYTVIKGFSVHSGPPSPISGISTPNDSTIVFHLTAATGDFLARLTLPSTAPIPQEVAKCFTSAGAYGRYVISSGPYMLQGSGSLNIKSCSTMKPIAGANPSSQFVLVRNPNYTAATDNPAVRQDLINGVAWTLDPNVQDIYNRIQAGSVDWTMTPPPSSVVQQYESNSSLRNRLKSNPANGTWILAMNMTQPPFDDTHVRRAMNWIMNKSSLILAAGGSIEHPFAQHDIPDVLVGNQLVNYAPFATPGNTGSLAKAEAEMKLSKYDPAHDGKCDVASVCNGVLIAIPNYAPATNMQAALLQSLGEIGIKPVIREFGNPYSIFGDVSKNLPANTGVPLSADYPDPAGWYSALEGSGIAAQGNFNWSMLGLKPAQAKSLRITGTVTGVPSLDSAISACNAITGTARDSCFAKVDQTMTGDIASWVPLFKNVNVTAIATQVTSFEFDQAQGFPSLAHVALGSS
jgi:peptide/nickel transport system substrate-binding protein